MPQLDPSSFASQLFWLTISFVLLYVVLARFLLPRVGHVLSLRAHTIESDLSAAGQMKTAAEQAKVSYEKALSDARKQSQTMLAEAQASINAQAGQHQAAMQRTIDNRLNESATAITNAKQVALGKVSPVSGELAALIVEALVHHKPTSQEVGAALNEISKRSAA